MASIDFTLQTFEYFMLILIRIASFMITAPFFSQTNTPTRLKIGFSAVVAILIYSVVPVEEVAYQTAIGYGIMALKEGITGLLIGYGASICNSIILYAGSIMDMDIGLGMVTQFDPTFNAPVSATGNMYQYFIMMLLIVSNMHHYILKTAIESFELIPLGGMVFQPDEMMLTMVKYITDLFVIAFRIVLPVFACIMVLNVVLGIMAKVAPQMNMFAVGFQLKILVGFAVLLLTIFLLPDIANFIFKEMKELMALMIEGMR